MLVKSLSTSATSNLAMNSTCSNKQTCIKFLQPHLTEKCNKQTETPPLCINSKGAHPANHKMCPLYLDHLNKVENTRNLRNMKAINKPFILGLQKFLNISQNKHVTSRAILNQPQWPHVHQQADQKPYSHMVLSTGTRKMGLIFHIYLCVSIF